MGDSHQLPDRALGSQSKPLKRHRAALCFRLFALARDWCDLGAVTLPLSVGLGPWPPQGTPRIWIPVLAHYVGCGPLGGHGHMAMASAMAVALVLMAIVAA